MDLFKKQGTSGSHLGKSMFRHQEPLNPEIGSEHIAEIVEVCAR